MVKVNDYYMNRLKLLKAIKKEGDTVPLSVLCRNIFAPGKSTTDISNQMEDDGFIIKEKHSRMVKTSITEKGERLIKVLEELKEVVESGIN